MTSVGGIFDGVLIPLKPSDYPAAIVDVIVSTSGVIGTSLSLCALIYGMNAKTSANTLLTISLLTGNFLFVFSIDFFMIGSLIRGGWWSGPAGCTASAIISIMASEVALLSIAGMALERYISVFHNTAISRRKVCIWISAIWTWSFIMILIIICNGSYLYTLALPLGNIGCDVAFWDRHQYSYVVEVMVIMTIVVPVVGQIYSYLKLIVRYRELQAQLQKSRVNLQSRSAVSNGKLLGKSNGTSGPGETVGLPLKGKEDLISKTGTKLLVKGVCISSFFVILWTPFLIKVIANIASGSPIPAAWDQFADILAVANSSYTCGVLYYFDNVVRKSVNRLLGIEIRKTKQDMILVNKNLEVTHTMVRFKNRYFLVQVEFQGKEIIDGLTTQSVSQAIKETVEELYGSVGSALLSNLHVKYYSPYTGLAIVRASLAEYKKAWYGPNESLTNRVAMTFTSTVRKRRCRMTVVHTSGTIKKVQEKCIWQDGKEIRQLVAEGRMNDLKSKALEAENKSALLDLE